MLGSMEGEEKGRGWGSPVRSSTSEGGAAEEEIAMGSRGTSADGELCKVLREPKRQQPITFQEICLTCCFLK